MLCFSNFALIVDVVFSYNIILDAFLARYGGEMPAILVGCRILGTLCFYRLLFLFCSWWTNGLGLFTGSMWFMTMSDVFTRQNGNDGNGNGIWDESFHLGWIWIGQKALIRNWTLVFAFKYLAVSYNLALMSCATAMSRLGDHNWWPVTIRTILSQYPLFHLLLSDHLVNGRAVTFRNASHITSLLQFSAEEGLETGAWTAPAHWLLWTKVWAVSCPFCKVKAALSWW